MGRNNGSTVRTKRARQASKRSRFLADRMDLDLLVRYANQRDNERVWLGRRYGAFQRTFTLPEHVDGDKLSATLAEGVLSIRVPTRPEAKPRKIPIGDGSTKRLTEGND